MILLLVFLSLPALAEEEDDDFDIKRFISKKRVNAAYIMFGGNRLNLNRLNSFLGDRDLPGVECNYFSYGFGGHVINDKLVLGLEIVRTITNDNPGNKSFNTSARARYFTLNFGYLMHFKKGLTYYPYAGMGVGQLILDTTQNNISSFDDIITAQNSTEAKRTSFLLNLGFGLDYFIKYNPRRKGRNNLIVGIRAGWMMSPVRRDWRVNGLRVHHGPDTAISGPYFRVIVGLGGWIERLIIQAIK
jgi:opacity protein-like surface antigen